MRIRTVEILLCLTIVAALSSARPTRGASHEVKVGPCPAKHEMRPPKRPLCGADRRGSKYLREIHRTILRALGFPFSEGVNGFVAISYGEGPTVESVCWSEFGDELEEEQLVDLARRVGEVRVPRQLECLEGHRLVHELVKEWKGPVPETPPGVRRF